MTDYNIYSRRSAITVLAAAGLSACSSAPRPKRPNPVFEAVNFSGPPFPLAVNDVNVTVRPRLSGDASPADADFPVPPEQIARLWPKQKIRAVGGEGVLQYVIDDASAFSRVTETGEVVIAVIQVRMILGTNYGVEAAGAGARVDSEARFTGFPSIIERQEALHDLSLDMAQKLDAQLTTSIKQQLGPFIRT